MSRRHEIVRRPVVAAAVGILWRVADRALHGRDRVDRGGHACSLHSFSRTGRSDPRRHQATARHLGQNAGDARSHTASHRIGGHNPRAKYGRRDGADSAGDRCRDAHHPRLEVTDCPSHIRGSRSFWWFWSARQP
ncbi:hypothetical protein [Alcaligenes sp. SMD-FA]|uniref:hypothetical protein n=1 Tax=Alcaligenes sp. SMD-FA TaxID=2991054 RepID=UPI002225FC1B|nr:hypothetical protein [Alcaligenes sp. SMD-FA]UYY86308.1 hypothetical protein OKX01_13470 [Alcaligenes sp. SMD-FA]